MSSYQQVHEPAMTLQEAAMLPAQTAGEATAAAGYASGRPGRLLMPRRESDFIPVETELETAAEAVTVQNRQGSMAGRSVLRAAGISMPGLGGMSHSYYRISPEAWDGCPPLCCGCCYPWWDCPGCCHEGCDHRPGCHRPGFDDCDRPGCHRPGFDDCDRPGCHRPGFDDCDRPGCHRPGFDDCDRPGCHRPGFDGCECSDAAGCQHNCCHHGCGCHHGGCGW